MNPKLIKLVITGVIGLGTSALIGSIVKTEIKLGEAIGEHFTKKSQ